MEVRSGQSTLQVDLMRGGLLLAILEMPVVRHHITPELVFLAAQAERTIPVLPSQVLHSLMVRPQLTALEPVPPILHQDLDAGQVSMALTVASVLVQVRTPLQHGLTGTVLLCSQPVRVQVDRGLPGPLQALIQISQLGLVPSRDHTALQVATTLSVLLPVAVLQQARTSPLVLVPAASPLPQATTSPLDPARPLRLEHQHDPVAPA
jgi:hypothetical protein